MAKQITNRDDIIDSRDVIARIRQLEDDADGADELKALEALAHQGEGFADWPHGETLVRESYFTDYAKQFAEDVGAIKGDEQWPATCIDWEKAADELRLDWDEVEFDGVTYLIQG